jgi:integrase
VDTRDVEVERGQRRIATRRSKTGEPVFWPCPATLTVVLADAPEHSAITLCANSRGKAWTTSGFRASWRPIKLRLEREGKIGPGLTLYGLRHTVAVILREIGMDERTIADALGREANMFRPLSGPRRILHSEPAFQS